MSGSAVFFAPDGPSTRALFLPGRLLLLACATAVVCAGSRTGILPGPIAAALAIAAVAIAMAHGAYDHLQGRRRLAPRFGARWPLVFFPAYLLLAGLTLAGWRFAPVTSLLLFLAYSSWHFGLEPEGRLPGVLRLVTGFALGALPIVAACRWQPSEVNAIFSQMLGPSSNHAGPLTGALGSACGPLAALALVGAASGALVRPLADRLQLAASVGLQLALFFFCQPVIAFAVFFCCWHTPEHLLATSLPDGLGSTLRGNLLSNLRAGLGPWMLSVATLAGMFVFGRQGLVAHQAQLFVLLSALTVPHMALDELRRVEG